MCFSASASFLAGGALSATGVVTIKKAEKKSELPFASLPLLFGLQQTVEGILWLALGNNASVLASVMTFIFSLFAYAFWPVFVPFAVRTMETVAWRKKVLSVLASIGLAIGVYLLYYIVKYPVTAMIGHHHIEYTQIVPFGYHMFWAYLGVSSLSCFLSSHTFVRVFGVLMFLSVPASYYIHSAAFVSIWCFFAALLSVVVYLHFRVQKSKHQRHIRS